jgi:hypothetical protein
LRETAINDDASVFTRELDDSGASFADVNGVAA